MDHESITKSRVVTETKLEGAGVRDARREAGRLALAAARIHRRATVGPHVGVHHGVGDGEPESVIDSRADA